MLIHWSCGLRQFAKTIEYNLTEHAGWEADDHFDGMIESIAESTGDPS